MSLLALEGIVAGHGELTVLRGLSLGVAAGEVHCLSGRNGAGKSTLLHLVAGLIAPRAGTIVLAGEDITARPAEDRPALGIGYVPQGRRLFGGLSVAENLDVAAGAVRAVSSRPLPGRDAVIARFPVLAERLGQRAATLSGGEQQMLATARALLSGPRVLLMDEPTEGLQPSMVQTIRETASALAADGVAVLLVEQRLDEVLDICARVTFMENGELRGTHAAGEVRADETLVRRYLGVG